MQIPNAFLNDSNLGASRVLENMSPNWFSIFSFMYKFVKALYI